MKFETKDWVLVSLVIVVLFFLWRRVSTYEDVAFPKDLGEMEAEALFVKKSTEFTVEMGKKLEVAQNNNDLGSLQKLGNEGTEALKKLQTDYHNYLRSKGKEVNLG
jgi:alpha-N-acetylglucosamine transferase